MDGSRAALAVVALIAAASAALPLASSETSGVWDARERGCYCHGTQPSDAVGFTVTGLPGRYVAGANYTFEVAVVLTDVAAVPNRSQGGFYLAATAGALSPAPGMGDLVQVQGLQATRTANGSLVRAWRVDWTAPQEAGLESTFAVFVDTVNGNKSETFGTDHWTFKTVRVGVGDEPEVQGSPRARPPMVFETYGVLLLGAGFGAYALCLFFTARRRP